MTATVLWTGEEVRRWGRLQPLTGSDTVLEYGGGLEAVGEYADRLVLSPQTLEFPQFT